MILPWRRRRRPTSPATVPETPSPPAAASPADGPTRPGRDLPVPPPVPAVAPGWMHATAARAEGVAALRAWRDAERRWRADVVPRDGVAALGVSAESQLARLGPGERIAGARRRVGWSAVLILLLLVLNLATSPQYLWAAFPAIGIAVDLARRLAALWADGLPVAAVFRPAGPPPPRARPAPPADAAPNEREALEDGVPRALLRGPLGVQVRAAYTTRAAVRMIAARVREADRALLPEVVPTVEALVDRVRLVTTALHRLGLDPETAMDADAVARRRAALGPSVEEALTLLESLRADLAQLRTAGASDADA